MPKKKSEQPFDYHLLEGSELNGHIRKELGETYSSEWASDMNEALHLPVEEGDMKRVRVDKRGCYMAIETMDGRHTYTDRSLKDDQIDTAAHELCMCWLEYREMTRKPVGAPIETRETDRKVLGFVMQDFLKGQEVRWLETQMGGHQEVKRGIAGEDIFTGNGIALGEDGLVYRAGRAYGG